MFFPYDLRSIKYTFAETEKRHDSAFANVGSALSGYVRNVGEVSERSELTAVVVGAFVQDFAQCFFNHTGLVEHFFYLLNEITIA